MATRDFGDVFARRVQDIVQPMVDEAVGRIVASLLGAGARGAGRGRPARRAARAGGAGCGVVGCGRPVRSMGWCASHYQAARKYGWPMPAAGPGTFAPEPRRLGRPPRSAGSSKAAPASKAARKRRRRRNRKAA
jgi:hypothetical protein